MRRSMKVLIMHHGGGSSDAIAHANSRFNSAAVNHGGSRRMFNQSHNAASQQVINDDEFHQNIDAMIDQMDKQIRERETMRM